MAEREAVIRTMQDVEDVFQGGRGSRFGMKLRRRRRRKVWLISYLGTIGFTRKEKCMYYNSSKTPRISYRNIQSFPRSSQGIFACEVYLLFIRILYVFKVSSTFFATKECA